MAHTTPALVRNMLEMAKARDGDDTPVTDEQVQDAIKALLPSGTSEPAHA